LGMGVALWFGRAALEAPLAAALPLALATLLGLIACGILVYFFLCQITGAARLSDLRRALRRG
ncbi:MAG: lipid II flippase MurJ, partial [Parvibaculum sp.]|nr:lipid II flippase MurJ [Parvibaculum sp.]